MGGTVKLPENAHKKKTRRVHPGGSFALYSLISGFVGVYSFFPSNQIDVGNPVFFTV